MFFFEKYKINLTEKVILLLFGFLGFFLRLNNAEKRQRKKERWQREKRVSSFLKKNQK